MSNKVMTIFVTHLMSCENVVDLMIEYECVTYDLLGKLNDFLRDSDPSTPCISYETAEADDVNIYTMAKKNDNFSNKQNGNLREIITKNDEILELRQKLNAIDYEMCDFVGMNVCDFIKCKRYYT